MKIAVLGNTGMLGSMVHMLLGGEENIRVQGFGRESLEIYPRRLGALGTKLSMIIGHHADYVVNCIGAIKPTFDKATDPSVPIYTNAVFPHQLAEWCDLTNTKLIHITTDCVYDGKRGQYVEADLHNPLDVYGKSKSLGEPVKAMNIRTSIIGPEFGGRKRSLLEWVKTLDKKETNGFTNHYWNGVTTLELAHGIVDIIDADLYTQGIFHVFSEDVTKHDLIQKIAMAYDLNIKINPVEVDEPVDRTLRTSEELNEYLQPSCLDRMLEDLAGFERNLNG